MKKRIDNWTNGTGDKNLSASVELSADDVGFPTDAVFTAGEVDPGQVGSTNIELSRLLRCETRTYRIGLSFGFVWNLILVFSLLGAAISSIDHDQFTTLESEFWRLEGPVLKSLLIVGCVAAIIFIWSIRSVRTRILDTVRRDATVENVSVMIRALQVEHGPIRHSVKQVLTRVLPLLRSEQACLVGRHERKILMRFLQQSSPAPRYIRTGRTIMRIFGTKAWEGGDSETTDVHTSFQVATLNAYEQIGGEFELEVVESLARNDVFEFTVLPVVVRTANECLPYLRLAAERQELERQLVRPSQINEADGAALLRPAGSVGAVNPEELVRSVEAQVDTQ